MCGQHAWLGGATVATAPDKEIAAALELFGGDACMARLPMQEHARGQHEQLPTPEFLLRGGTRRSKPESGSQSGTDGAPQFCRHALEGMHAFADLVLKGYGIKRNQACLKSLLSGCCAPLRPGRPIRGVGLHVGRSTARRHGRRRGDCDVPSAATPSPASAATSPSSGRVWRSPGSNVGNYLLRARPLRGRVKLCAGC